MLVRVLVDEMDRNGGSYEMNGQDKNMNVLVEEKDAGKPAVSVPATVESQTRVRRLFSTAQIFMFSLTYMALWEGMCTKYATGLSI